MSFKISIENTPLLKDAFRNGLKALGSNSKKIKLADSRQCEGSVDIDTEVRDRYPNASRWDYGIGYGETTHFIEVHSAKTDEVKSVLNKLAWLKDFLVKDAPDLNREKKRFHWVASGANHVLPHSSQARQLAQAGLIIVKELRL
jgi:hypothetical protein